MFNPSHTNIDERFISNKIASPSAPSGFKSFSDNTAYSRLNPMLNNLTNEMQFEDISTRLLKNFQLSNKYKKKLLEYFANQYQVDSDIEKYKMYNFEFWMDEFKRFLLNNLIPTMVQDHNENLDHLNNFFENSLNMQIVSYIVDDVDLDNFRKYMSGVIFDPNLKFKNYNRDMLKTGGGDNTLSYSARDGSYNKPNEDRLKIFFGDEEKLSFILALIEQKLNNLRKMNTQKIASTLFAKQGKENVNISNDSLDRQHLNNPFLIRSSQGLTDYDDMMLLHNTNFEENLKHLKKLLVLRMEINDKLKNYFIKEESNKHSQLIM